MSPRFFIVLASVTLVYVACGGNPSPIPVLGSGGSIRALVGEWTGEYRSSESGREGSIYFRLEAGADSATGDVLMVPADRVGHNHPEGVHPISEYVSITFVAIENGRVRGTLDPYQDPVCGCRLDTTFEGELRDGTIVGTYTSLHRETGLVQVGEWRVRRTGGDDPPERARVRLNH